MDLHPVRAADSPLAQAPSLQRSPREQSAGYNSSLSPTASLESPSQERLGTRALLLAALVLFEALALSLAFDGATLSARHGYVTAIIGHWAPWAVRFAIVFGALFAAAVSLRRIVLPSLGADRQPLIRPQAAALHLAALGAFIAVSRLLYGSSGTSLPDSMVSGTWIALAVITAATAAFIVLAPRQWLSLLASLWTALAGIAGGAAGACFLGSSAARLWEPARWLTFTMVQKGLAPIIPTLVVQPERYRIATGRFGVLIAPECSGLEGIGLMLVFGVLWTAAFYRVLGVARCVALLAGACVVLYGLNVLRIAALVLIGHAGARDIAVAGFHSQAGWIAFSTVALGLTFLGQRVAGRSDGRAAGKPHADNSAEPLLVPFWRLWRRAWWREPCPAASSGSTVCASPPPRPRFGAIAANFAGYLGHHRAPLQLSRALPPSPSG